GPHHSAQKSTSTGWRLDSSITSLTKVWVVVSLTTLLGAAPSPLCTSSFRPSFVRAVHAGRLRPFNWTVWAIQWGIAARGSRRAPPRRKPEYGQLNGVNGGVCNR